MPFYDFFKKFLGLSSIPDKSQENFDERPNSNNRDDYRNQFWGSNNENYEDSWSGHEHHDGGMQFNIFTDPLEMHRYFEQQMNEVLKSFTGMFSEGGSDSFFGFSSLPPHSQLPQIEPPSKNLREQFLKPGFENTRERNRNIDSDLDGKIDANDLDTLLKNKPSNEVAPFHDKMTLPQLRTFGQSISSKTIQRPDGTIETHRTVRDNAGNEETTVVRRFGDKQHTVTIRTDKNGHQEKFEDMVNIDEKELRQFTDKWQPHEPLGDEDFNKWFPFDKFFK